MSGYEDTNKEVEIDPDLYWQVMQRDFFCPIIFQTQKISLPNSMCDDGQSSSDSKSNVLCVCVGSAEVHAGPREILAHIYDDMDNGEKKQDDGSLIVNFIMESSKQFGKYRFEPNPLAVGSEARNTNSQIEEPNGSDNSFLIGITPGNVRARRESPFASLARLFTT